jgi:hypothetical protein
MRRPLLTPAELTAEQRAVYEACDAMTQAEEYQGFEVKNAEGAFVGPWGVLMHFPHLAQPLGQFTNVAQKLPGLSERARQVVILTIGARFNVAYELYAHALLAVRAGLIETVPDVGETVPLTVEDACGFASPSVGRIERDTGWLRAARWARWLAWASLLWMCVEGAVGLWQGFVADANRR